MRLIIGFARIAYVNALRGVATMLPAESVQRFVEIESIRQCSLACEAGVGFDDLALEELIQLRPRFITLPSELNRLATNTGPARSGARVLAEQVRSEFL